MKKLTIYWKTGATSELDVFSVTQCEKFWYAETFNGEVRIPIALVDGGDITEYPTHKPSTEGFSVHPAQSPYIIHLDA